MIRRRDGVTATSRRGNQLAVARVVALLLVLRSVAGCTGTPPLVLNGDSKAPAPAGPKVAALVANLKCELWNAANSKAVLPFYFDDADLTRTRNRVPPDDPRAFTLENMLREIEYIGEATFTLDVTQTGALNPSETAAKYYNVAIGELPATGATLSVGGQLSEAAHRYITFTSSADFSRLNDAQPNPFTESGTRPTPVAHPPSACNRGIELGGRLGLTEALATGMITAAMNDIAVFPSAGTSGAGLNVEGVTPAISVPSTFAFGQISTQIDFTVTEGIGGGPNWVLKYIALPIGRGPDLLNFQRKVIDTLVVTFVPVCVRQGYWTSSSSPPFDYVPRMVEGTPGWANFLPPCSSASHIQDQINAIAKAKSNNDQILLQNSLLQR